MQIYENIPKYTIFFNTRKYIYTIEFRKVHVHIRYTKFLSRLQPKSDYWEFIIWIYIWNNSSFKVNYRSFKNYCDQSWFMSACKYQVRMPPSNDKHSAIVVFCIVATTLASCYPSPLPHKNEVFVTRRSFWAPLLCSSLMPSGRRPATWKSRGYR